ncbi:hypothetical protein F4801DRAFT_531603 [Xylaria longipes]|nr:hypothetical protein F4801DRAFT_531603 [Xylaria longipes]RYC54669.1 hypothetical protein CHU98_g11543 [Xylaria longipes]
MSSSISRLPDSATRLISSHVVVVTPVLLVKELLDNAIDAKATSVEILVSPDTISRIEVRDDGVGIHPNDYDALGKRGHTSKLRSIEELGNLVGKTLGFRGEALASVNSMADVTITTKISTEPIAAVLQLIPNKGGILTQKPTSAPVGTTVSITKLFDRQPVRRQMATKEAKKSLEKIQELLRSYAMARPQLRLLFKVLQTPTKAWSYSPKCNATPSEAALQLFGIEVASGCLLKTFQTSHISTDSDSTAREISQPANNDYVLEVFLANPNMDIQKVPKRHYFSVDGRPINTGRGIAKRLLNIYLDHLKSSTLTKGTSDCFIRINISCPPGSYDANIEPSKDNVLFSDEQVVLKAFRHLCNETYKPIAVGQQCTMGTSIDQTNGLPAAISLAQSEPHRMHEPQSQPSIPSCPREMVQNIPKVHADVSNNDPKQPVNQASQETQPSNTFKPINAMSSPRHSQLGGSGNQEDRAPSTPNQWRVDMSLDLSERPKRSHQKSRQGVPVPSSSDKTTTVASGGNGAGGYLNPWEIAKSGSNQVSLPNLDTAVQYPPVSPLTPELPVLRHIMAPPGDLDVPRSHKDAGRAKRLCPPQTTVPGGPYRSPVSSPLENRPRGIPIVSPNRPQINLSRRRHREQPPWIPPSSLENPRLNNTSEINSTHSQCADGFKQTQISFGGAQANRRQRGAQDDISQPRDRSKIPLDELEADGHLNIQDIFSTAKKNLNYQLSRIEDGQLTKTVHNRESQRHHQQPSRQRQPFSVLKPNSFRNNEAPQADREPIATTLPIGDPRAYLLRRQKSMAAEENGAKPRKLRRVKSSLMPLENILPEHDTHSFSWTVRIDSSALNELIQWARQYDEYVIYGTLLDGLDMSLADGQVVESQLQKLLTEQKENIADGDAEDGRIIIGLRAALKGKSVPDAPGA